MDIVPFTSLEDALKEKKITLRTYERVKIAKSYIEKKYKMKKEEEEEKRKDWDLIVNKIDELQVTEEEADKIKKAILHKEGEQLRIKRQKINIRDFVPINIIGKGAFGEVRVCRYNPTGEVVAIKKMKKEEMHRKNQVLHVRAEKDVLSEANNSWIVDLKYSFQDSFFLYLVMEFLPGGDLMSLLMAKDILSEADSRFYAAELILAIESVHKLNCIHRDLKPDNVLIHSSGHIKLSDFGLSKKIDLNFYDEIINGNKEANAPISLASNYKDFASLSKNRKRRIFAFSTVGTPDYIAPEVFSQKGYGPEVDWWSLGVILFEMLIGYPPFFSDSATETCKKILNWKNNLIIPPETKISKEALDLIKKLITDVDKRLGYHGADEIKKHPFFKNLDWNNLSSMTPPFIPEIENPWDTKYFDNFEEDEPFYPQESNGLKKGNKDFCFVDFTYKRGGDNVRQGIVSALEVFDSLKESIFIVDRIKDNGGASEVKSSIVINNQKLDPCAELKRGEAMNLNGLDRKSPQLKASHEAKYSNGQNGVSNESNSNSHKSNKPSGSTGVKNKMEIIGNVSSGLTTVQPTSVSSPKASQGKEVLLKNNNEMERKLKGNKGKPVISEQQQENNQHSIAGQSCSTVKKSAAVTSSNSTYTNPSTEGKEKSKKVSQIQYKNPPNSQSTPNSYQHVIDSGIPKPVTSKPNPAINVSPLPNSNIVTINKINSESIQSTSRTIKKPSLETSETDQISSTQGLIGNLNTNQPPQTNSKLGSENTKFALNNFAANYGSNANNHMITTNYLKDFTHSESLTALSKANHQTDVKSGIIGANKTFNSKNPLSQVSQVPAMKINQGKDFTNIIMSKSSANGNDGKALSTKCSSGLEKKISNEQLPGEKNTCMSGSCWNKEGNVGSGVGLPANLLGPAQGTSTSLKYLKPKDSNNVAGTSNSSSSASNNVINFYSHRLNEKCGKNIIQK